MSDGVGILGGTFDPVHVGHLRPALEAMQTLGLAQVRFVPNRLPPHRVVPEVGADQRLEMLRLAIRDQPGFCVDERELRRDGLSYTVDTLRSVREDLGTRPVSLIMGMDAFLGLPHWHRWSELFQLAHIAVTRRPGAVTMMPSGLQALLRERQVADASELSRHPAGLVHFMDVTQLEISATELRRNIASGGSGRYLMPEDVWRYIERNALYRREPDLGEQIATRTGQEPNAG